MDVYQRLPGPLQSIAASWRGYRLQAMRYGPETERLVAEALERDTWSAEKWKAWREEKLARILHRAATRVPWYRDQWAARRRAGDQASWDVLENWPILGKQSVRENARAFVEEGVDPRTLHEGDTSGTTGTPLRFWHSRETLVGWYAIFEARIRRWNGVRLEDRWAHVGGQRVTPATRRRPPFWVWNQGMHQLYMSSYHISPGAIEAYLGALKRYRIVYLFGYASALYGMARVALERGLAAPRMTVAVSNAEPLFDFQREAITAAFGCPIRDTYGQAEIVCGGSECASGLLHVWPEVGVQEWMRDGADEPAPPGEVGRLICTTLLEPKMPLIRYAVGDRSAPALPSDRCACGRGLPIIRSFEGRTADLMLTRDGSPVGGLDTIFHAGLPMREAQIVQETLERFRINVVPAPGFGPEHEQDLVRGLRLRMGPDVEVLISKLEAIPRTANGKYRIQLSLLPDPGRFLKR